MPRLVLLAAFASAVALSLGGGCAALQLPAPRLPMAGDPSAPVGTPPWWKAHKKKATLVVGSGWQVEGVPGYFDDSGRPINQRVAKVVDKTDGGGLLGDADFKKAVTGFKEQVGLGPDQAAAQEAYAAGESLFRAQRYGDAAKKFKEAAKSWPDSPLEQDALFQMGESYFFATRYRKAVDAYEKLIQEHPNTQHLDKLVTRQFSIAQYWEKYHNYDPHWAMTPNFFNRTRPLFDTLGRSMKTYENIRLNDPTGPLADDAIMAQANSYFLRGRYVDADYQYDLLRKEYPRSTHQYEAHLLGLESKLRKYQGEDYDGTPLEEAKVLVKQLKVQFAGELDDAQKTRLAETDMRLNRAMAMREFSMARHFDNIEEYGSAKYYYAEVIRNYPQTQLAEDSRARIDQLGGLPDRPEEKLAFLVDLLPESAERRAVAQVPLATGETATRLAQAAAEQEASQEGGDARGQTIQR